MKVGVIGAVGTTLLTLEELVLNGFEVVGVLGHEPINPSGVSGLKNLKIFSEENNIDYLGYQKINNPMFLEWMRERKPEIIFAVGFSQLLGMEWLTLSPKGCIGFHPTLLPYGRGRAPIAWQILEGVNGAATFFQMGEGADDGAIHVQKTYTLSPDDDAETLVPKLQMAIRDGLKEWLPKLKSGYWNPIEQDHSKATYFGKREPADGLINWANSAEFIDRLVKASCRPHPGAFTFCGSKIIKIWKSKVVKDAKIKGVVGRILEFQGKDFLVQCGVNHLLVTEYSYIGEKKLREGTSFELNFNGSLEDLNKIVLE